MKLLVDENIPLARELFGPLGEVTLVRGRDVDENMPGLETFDALAIRSVTNVTPALVDRAVRARLIGTATIGTDHIDMAYIGRANIGRRNPITVVSAPGSNADSVADYVFYALTWLTGQLEEPLAGRTLGIIGCGNCGSRVAKRAAGFGMKVLRCDPPLAERAAGFASDPFEATIAADFVTCHVPLTEEGESAHPTHHMIGQAQIGRMRPGACLINSSRGAVVDSPALAAALRQGAVRAVLDVYEGEPEPLVDLLELAALATPHVAGYAVEAKRRGAVVVYEALCRAFDVEPQDTTPLLMQGFRPPAGERVGVAAAGPVAAQADAAVRALFGRIYDVGATSRELKATASSPQRGALFDAMRKNYDRDYARHELSAYAVGFGKGVAADLRQAIGQRLGGFGVRAVEQGAHYVLEAE
jgi:erythronate-4-phosphate dehydrogenase